MLQENTLQKIEQWAAQCGGIVSVSVRDIRNATDYSFNDEVRMGSASTIKVPMIVEAMNQVRDGKLSLEQEFPVPADIHCAGSGVLTHLHPGIVVSLKDLLTLMIIVSDNTATNMLIDILGTENVNATLCGMGFTGTALQRKMYDTVGMEKGLDNYVVAREMAELLVKIARGEAAGSKWDDIIIDIMHHQLYCDQLGLLLPGEAKLANKTGQREEVAHDCGIVTTNRFSYSIAVCTKDAKVAGEAKVMIGRISRAVFDDIRAANEYQG